MNVHKNARSCPLSRELLVKRVSEQGWSVRAASEAGGMSGAGGSGCAEWNGANLSLIGARVPVHVATDDASRVCYAQIFPDECTDSAIQFFVNALDWFARHGVTIEAAITDNGPAYKSHRFAEFCRSRNIKHLRIKPHRPQTNGKVERFIQTLLREWAYRFSYSSSVERSAGSLHTFTSITSIEPTPLFHTMRRSVAWIGRTS